MMELGNGWYCSTRGDIPKNIDCTEFICVPFTKNSDWCRMSVWKYKHKYSLDLDCFETKRNVDDVFN